MASLYGYIGVLGRHTPADDHDPPAPPRLPRPPRPGGGAPRRAWSPTMPGRARTCTRAGLAAAELTGPLPGPATENSSGGGAHGVERGPRAQPHLPPRPRPLPLDGAHPGALDPPRLRRRGSRRDGRAHLRRAVPCPGPAGRRRAMAGAQRARPDRELHRGRRQLHLHHGGRPAAARDGLRRPVGPRVGHRDGRRAGPVSAAPAGVLAGAAGHRRHVRDRGRGGEGAGRARPHPAPGRPGARAHRHRADGDRRPGPARAHRLGHGLGR